MTVPDKTIEDLLLILVYLIDLRCHVEHFIASPINNIA